MVILDAPPAVLIADITTKFTSSADKATIARISDTQSTLDQARELSKRAGLDALKTLSVTLNRLKSNYSETTKNHSSADHATEISQMDSSKFRTAKSLTSLESTNSHLSAELAGLQARLAELENEGPEGGKEARRTEMDDEVVLKLSVYRSLGMEVERGSDGEYRKMVVRGRGKGDVMVVDVDGKGSRAWYAGYFWGAL